MSSLPSGQQCSCHLSQCSGTLSAAAGSSRHGELQLGMFPSQLVPFDTVGLVRAAVP